MQPRPPPIDRKKASRKKDGPTHLADYAATDQEYYRRILHELKVMGADLARLAHEHARSKIEAIKPGRDPEAGPAAEETITFDDVVRPFRRPPQ